MEHCRLPLKFYHDSDCLGKSEVNGEMPHATGASGAVRANPDGSDHYIIVYFFGTVFLAGGCRTGAPASLGKPVTFSLSTLNRILNGSLVNASGAPSNAIS